MPRPNEDELFKEPQVTFSDFSKIIDYKDPIGCCFGHYNYASLCMPRWPFCQSSKGRWKEKKKGIQFYPVNEPLPWLLALLMGFQHAIAMVGGIIVPPLIISATQSDPSIRSYLVSASLITSGIGSVLQCMRFRIFKTGYFYGTGLITVVGTGIQQVQVLVAALKLQTKKGISWEEAYGKLLGSLALSSFLVIFISFLPPKIMRRIFPPWIAGLTVFVSGVSLIGIGMGNWGGGNDCINNINSSSDNSNSNSSNGDNVLLCRGNGDVLLPFGHGVYIGIGAVVFFTIIFIELFGSPLLRNVQIMVGFLVGYLFSAIVRYEGKKFINTAAINDSPSFQFLWFKTFRLSFYPSSILPLLIAFAVDSSNTIGDITASEEASGLPTFGSEHVAHLQGGLLADGVNSLFCALATVTPVLVYAQNNGVISFTMVASRIAGTFCGLWLFVLGIFGKFGGFVANAPNPVLGGMQVVIFASVAVAGLRLMNMVRFNRRIRFIQVLSGGVGLGATLLPSWGTNSLWNFTNEASGLVRALGDSGKLLFGTGFALTFLLAVILHNLLPLEEDPKALAEAAERNAYTYQHSNESEGEGESDEEEAFQSPGSSVDRKSDEELLANL